MQARVRSKEPQPGTSPVPEQQTVRTSYADIAKPPLWSHFHGNILQRAMEPESATAATGTAESEDATKAVCPENRKEVIATAQTGAWQMLDDVIAHMDSYDGTEPAVTRKMLEKYFKRSTERFARRIAHKLRRIRRRSEKSRYRCVEIPRKPCDEEGDRAVATPCVGGLAPVTLCTPNFFDDVPLEQEKTLIHEWFHQYGCKGDVAYEDDAEFAGLATRQSLFNADSFAEFVGDYYWAL